MSLPLLPIDEVLPRLVESLRGSACAVLRAPTGAGKTSRVPPALLDAGLAGEKQVVVLQPRRLAARAAAWRMATERGVNFGGEVGYHVRFERQAGPQTRILVVTEGIFLRLVQDDPLLENVGAVVLDEFHERSLDADLALALARRVQTEVRPDLKIVVMSATLAVAPVAAYLGDCPRLESAGRLFPIAIQYLRHEPQEPIHVTVASQVAAALETTSGDLLVFLPGLGEIRRTASALQSLAESQGLAIRELYGDMPLEEQQAVLQAADRRKIVLATNVAETSVTIPGITGVIDSGLARSLRFDPARGLNRLEIERISRASADQRAGRAGRTGPGVCFRLWTEREHHALRDEMPPEISRVDVSGAVLQLLAWGERDVRAFSWFEPPPAAALEQAETLLRRLAAVDARGITSLGHRMARLPVHPRLGRLLVEGAARDCADRAALAAALLSERDPFVRSRSGPARPAPRHGSDSDLLDRLVALDRFAQSSARHSDTGTLDSGAARHVLRVRDQLLRLVDRSSRATRSPGADEPVLRSLLAAFPDRVARRRPAASRRGVMVGGRGVRLADESGVTEPDLFVCVDLEEIGKNEALVRQASAVDRDWLPEELLTSSVEVEFDPQRLRVVAYRRTRYEDLVLDEAPTSLPAGFDAAPILAAEAALRLERGFEFGEAETRFLARARCLAEWLPELQLPDLGADLIQRLLPRLCQGCVSLEDVRRAPMLDVLRSLFTHQQLQAIEREAPERLEVPSGSHVALEYEPGKPPVLAVRIQEIFGWRETPRIARGRVGVLLHLLGPNMRPQQVTADLASFWRNTYPEVRKELRRRYPKHAWPEDPWTATPERRPGRKRP